MERRYAQLRAQRRRTAPYSRRDIFTRWDNACGYCGAPAGALDHIQPLSRGGADVLRNVIPVCDDCNASKGTQTLAEWAFGPTEENQSGSEPHTREG